MNGADVTSGSSARSDDTIGRLQTAAAAVESARDGGFLASGDVLLVLAAEVHLGLLSDLCREVHPGPLVSSTTARDAVGLITTPTGRADVVVTLFQAREAVRAVRRGGTVCLPLAEVDAPSVTELVQREVRLVGAHSTMPATAPAPAVGPS